MDRGSAVPIVLVITFAFAACSPSSPPPAPLAPPPKPTAAIQAPVSPPLACDAPPFGDTPDNYATVVSSAQKSVAKYGEQIGNVTAAIMKLALIEACQVKFQKADREDFHNHGITDSDIAVTSPVGLASQYVNFTSAQREQERALEQAQRVRDTPLSVSVRDFAVDGASLKGRMIRVGGSYIYRGGLDFLYENTQAVIMATQANTVEPSIPLLMDDASHAARALMVNCRSDPGAAQVGCRMTLIGRVEPCTVTSAFGGQRDVVCLHVKTTIESEMVRQAAAPPLQAPPPSIAAVPAAQAPRNDEEQQRAYQWNRAREAQEASAEAYGKCVAGAGNNPYRINYCRALYPQARAY